MSGKAQRWRFAIDCGGTFTDCLGFAPSGERSLCKVLSAVDGPVRAIETLLARAGEPTAAAELDCAIRLGTTVATNALLERRGVPTLLVAPRGLAGVFDIGTQERPALFELEIAKPARLHQFVCEVAGRRSAAGRLIEPLDPVAARAAMATARADGARAVAIVLMHAHLDGHEEEALAAIAREQGFEEVVCSHASAREIGLLARGETAIADAYLTPRLREHIDHLRAALPRADLSLMQSSGGLTRAARFRAPHALVSGPAGGVLATHSVARRAGRDRAIGFDMGGTSTDVSLVQGDRLERSFESVVGGIRVKAPMLRLQTVAAGGGSLCRFDGARLTVGPESAGADPGPLCYARRDAGGALVGQEPTITDANFLLGRLLPDHFPFPLERGPVVAAFGALAARLAEAGFRRSPEEIAAGFVEIANAHMAQAIVEVCVARGVDPRDHVLVAFGGAGGQHACALARRLGIREILFHPLAALLSAYGIAGARPTWHGERDGRGRRLPEQGALDAGLVSEWDALAEEGRTALCGEGEMHDSIRIERSLELGHVGTETALEVAAFDLGSGVAWLDAARWRAEFARLHRDRFGYERPGRAIEIKAVRLRAIGGEPEFDAGLPGARQTPSRTPSPAPRSAPQALRDERAWFPTIGFVSAPVYAREALAAGDRLTGPVLIVEAGATVVVDPGFVLTLDEEGVMRLVFEGAAAEGVPARETMQPPAQRNPELGASAAGDAFDPVRLEILGSRFMSIAEQMGAVLRNTSVSTNIKERLDYSCAVFDRAGGLVANAPHIPVHLGAMADTVAAVRRRFAPFTPGDAIVTNDPFEGGSHLPDVTVVSPVFVSAPESVASAAAAAPQEPSFFVASRGHHADLGGAAPGSMPAGSTRLAQEGVLIEAFPLVRAGRFEEARLRRLLGAGEHPARRPDDNVADLEAMIAANRAGAARLVALVEEEGQAGVEDAMRALQEAAAQMVARELAKRPAGRHTFEDALDDGTPIRVALTLVHRPPGDPDPLPARMTIDFSGTGPASPGNLNAPPSVVRAAVIYVLRSIVQARIPLNGGCLAPVSIVIPRGSILDPPRGAAVAGGNVETSQRVVDVLLGALGRAAASQGTMNNIAFGDASFGYYETIGGGAGATPAADGASGVHTHMTNTRITDPEILETRFPVELLRFALRTGSGGRGRWQGGEGVERRLRFLRPVRVSLLTQRRLRAPFGLAGGQPGRPGSNRVRRAATGFVELLAGQQEVALEAGDELWIETPGGGGYGAEVGPHGAQPNDS